MSVCVCSEVKNVMDSKLKCTVDDGSVAELELHDSEYTANQINSEFRDITEGKSVPHLVQKLCDFSSSETCV